MNTGKPRRVATYEQSASRERRKAWIISSQQQLLANRLKVDPSAVLIGHYVDDGVSGLVPMGNRPAGALLLRDARDHRFDEVWVCDLDRLGRDNQVTALLRLFESLGVLVLFLSPDSKTPPPQHGAA